MGYYDQDMLEIYEKKYSIDEIMWMYQERRIHFANVRRVRSGSIMEKKVTEIIEAINMRIPFPTVYVSEQQNGDWVVLDVSDRLYYLVHYLAGDYLVGSGIARRQSIDFEAWYDDNPRLSGQIMDTTISFQIIEYRSPKYMHMFVGNFVENWSLSREYAVRTLIYQGPWTDIVSQIQQHVGGGRVRIYEIVYMLVIWGIFMGWIDAVGNIDAEEQCLIEVALIRLEQDPDRYIDAFADVLRGLVQDDWIYRELSKIWIVRSDEKTRAIVMGIIVCRMSRGQSIDILMDSGSPFRQSLHNQKITYEHVRRWLRME